jgi:hypothetical protein
VPIEEEEEELEKLEEEDLQQEVYRLTFKTRFYELMIYSAICFDPNGLIISPISKTY